MHDRPKTLISVATNLLNERTDVEVQKLWISLAHQIVDAYSKKIDVRSFMISSPAD